LDLEIVSFTRDVNGAGAVAGKPVWGNDEDGWLEEDGTTSAGAYPWIRYYDEDSANWEDGDVVAFIPAVGTGAVFAGSFTDGDEIVYAITTADGVFTFTIVIEIAD